jgi:alkylhydroperoxidase family enzyme
MDAALKALARSPEAPRYVFSTGKSPTAARALQVVGTFAHHPELAQAFFTFNRHILHATTLTLRQRQTLILRVAALRKSRFLWVQHQDYKTEAGMTDQDIARIAFGPLAPGLDSLDSALLNAADELIADGRLGAQTWTALSSELDVRQVMDVIFTVSCYDALARMNDSFLLDVEPDVRHNS